jgi:hypothetical protein
LRRIPAIVSFLNPQPALSLVGGNRSSCPIPAVRRHHKDRSRRWEAVIIRSLAIGWQRCASYGQYRGLGTARPAMNLGLSYLLGAPSHNDPDHPNEQVGSKLNWVQPAFIENPPNRAIDVFQREETSKDSPSYIHRFVEQTKAPRVAPRKIV